MSGWQRGVEDNRWHYFPEGPFMGLSACETVYVVEKRTRYKEPVGDGCVCRKCVEGMREIVETLEARKRG